MEDYIRSLKFKIKSLRRQIIKENGKLQDMSKSLNNEISGSSIECTVEFMKTNIDHLVKASAKLAQLENVYSSLLYEEEHK